MKTKSLIALIVSFIFTLEAQQTSITLTTPGSLHENVLRTVTNLKITGTIDASDFQFIRDSMSVDTLNLDEATICAYTGTGTFQYGFYPANEIPESAFYNDSTLKSIVLPSNLKCIGPYAFVDAINIQQITIPNSVDSIKMYAFVECTGLSTISFPSTVKQIGAAAFAGCTGLTGTINLPGISKIEQISFAYCTNLQHITVNNPIYSIEAGAFSDCNSLIDISYNSTNPSTIITENALFKNCYNLTSVGCSDKFNYIQENTFRNCQSLSSINLPIVRQIFASAFNGCTSLSTFSTGNRLTLLGDSAFNNCSSLSTITIGSTTPPTISATSFNNVNKVGCSLNIPTASTSLYQNATGWSEFFSIPTSVQNIEKDYSYKVVGRSVWVNSNSNCMVKISDTSGKIIFEGVVSGNKLIHLKGGIYIISLNNERSKLTI